MIIENFKLRTFLKQSTETISEYIIAFQYLKPIKTKYDVFHLTLENVEFIKKNLHSNNDKALIDVVKIVQGLMEWKIFGFRIKKPFLFGTWKVYSYKIIEFFSIVASIKEQIEVISRAEETSLSSSGVNIRWEIVQGSERMAKFGIYNTLESLSGGKFLDYDKIMQKEYSEIFTVLYMRKTSSELEKEMNELKLNK